MEVTQALENGSSEARSFISAGYYLVTPCSRPDWCHGGGADLVPSMLLTLSPCLTAVLPDGWPSPAVPAWRPDEARLRRLGIEPNLASEIEAWGDERCRAEPKVWPRPFFDVATLREFLLRFVESRADVVLVGASLPEDQVDRYLAEAGSDTATERLEAVQRALPAEPGGRFVGYEVLGDGFREAHSILCTGAEVPLHIQLGIKLNERGLLDSIADAERAAALMSDGQFGEPVAYFPWRLEIYTRP